MLSSASVSCSLFGMVRHHVTALAALFVCNLVLTSAHSTPNAALLKLLAANQAQAGDRESLLRHFNHSPSQPSATDEASQLWLNPELEDPATSGGSHEVEAEVEDDEAVPAKRFHPSAFFGSRGKRMFNGVLSGGDDLDKRFQHAFVGSRGKRGPSGEGEEGGEAMVKRFDPSGFSGSRGKRYMPGLEALLLSQMYKKLDAEKWKRQSLLGFHAARG